MKTKFIFAAIFTFLCILPPAMAQLLPLGSYQKIAKAKLEGKISIDEARGHNVLAFFADSELPEQFKADEGSSDYPPTDRLLNVAMPSLPKMPLALASRVYKYLIPEPYRPKNINKRFHAEEFPIPNSIPDQSWAFVDDIHAEVRIWFKKDDPEQLELAKLIKTILADEAIPSIKLLMGRTHMRDDMANASVSVAAGIQRKIPNGGDGKLDVYIHNIPAAEKARGLTTSYAVLEDDKFGCPGRPGYIALDYHWARYTSRTDLASTVAHEYFHVIQTTYDRKEECVEYSNVDEGTATYIKQHVYPNANEEHDWFQFMEDGNLSLIDAAYESWIFYYWMIENHGRNTMPSIYSNMAQLSVMDSINAVLDGGFKKQWIEYLVYHWNQEPLQDGFRFWDDYTYIPARGPKNDRRHMKPIEIEEVKLDSNGQFRKNMQMSLKPLTKDFYAFRISDSSIRSIAIENPVMMNQRKVRAKILVRKKGASQFEEYLWEDNVHQEYHYCFDKKDESIDLVVIAFGNYQHTATGATYLAAPAFKATNQPCYGFKGKLESEWNFKEGSSDLNLTVSGSDITYVESGDSNGGVFRNLFHATAGSVTWRFKGTIDNCTGEGAGSVTPILGANSGVLSLQSYNVAPEAWGQYVIGMLFENPIVEVTFVCPPPKKSFQKIFGYVLGNFYGDIPKHNGKAVYSGKNSGNFWTTTWDFSPIKE